mgnify:CR=1 FL=1
MPAKWHKYSYSAQLEERRTYISIIVLIVSLLIVFTVVHSSLITMYKLRSATMEPTLSMGDAIVTTPLYDTHPGTEGRFSLLVPSDRGDIVMLSPAYTKKINGFARFFRALVSFLSFQQIRPFSDKDSPGERPSVRRLVAIPGDSIYMDKYVLYVKPAGSSHYLTEFELVKKSYDISVDELPEGWSSTLPFSDSFPELTLGADEYFVLCDNRLCVSDSRIWGPVPADRVQGKVLFRYWPFSRLGAP